MIFAVKCPEWGQSPNLQTDQWSSVSASSVGHVRWRNDSSRPVTAFTLGDNTLLIPVAVRGALHEKGSPTVTFTSIPSALHGTCKQHRSCPSWSARLSHAWWAGSAPAGGLAAAGQSWLSVSPAGCPASHLPSGSSLEHSRQQGVSVRGEVEFLFLIFIYLVALGPSCSLKAP